MSEQGKDNYDYNIPPTAGVPGERLYDYNLYERKGDEPGEMDYMYVQNKSIIPPEVPFRLNEFERWLDENYHLFDNAPLLSDLNQEKYRSVMNDKSIRKIFDCVLILGEVYIKLLDTWDQIAQSYADFVSPQELEEIHIHLDEQVLFVWTMVKNLTRYWGSELQPVTIQDLYKRKTLAAFTFNWLHYRIQEWKTGRTFKLIERVLPTPELAEETKKLFGGDPIETIEGQCRLVNLVKKSAQVASRPRPPEHSPRR